MQQVDKIDDIQQRCATFLSAAFAADRVAPLIREAGAACCVEIVRAHQNRCTLRYRFPSGSIVYAKAYRGLHGCIQFSTLCALWKAGFNAGPFRIPEPLAFLKEENLVLMRAARGTPLSRELAECSLETAIDRVQAAARWLVALHSSQLSSLELEGPCERSKILKESDILAQASAASPAYSPALIEFLDYVHELAQGSPLNPPLAPTHGQFTPSTLFTDADIATAIDLDTLSLSDPAKDVATFVSKMKYRELFKPDGDCDRGARLASEFLDEYVLGTEENLVSLPYYLALYGLKEFSKALVARGSDRASRDRAERLCRTELQHLLREGAPERSLPTKKKGERPVAEVIAAWSALCSTPTNANAESCPEGVKTSSIWQEAREADASVVQAKHTARDTLSLTSKSGERLYAKWYPDHLGRRCARVVTALWASGFGPDSPYRVPEIAAFVPDRTVLLMRAAEGVPFSSVLETASVAEAVRGGRDAARWLLALHRSPIRIGALERDWISLKAFRVPQRLIEVCGQFPEFLPPLLKTLYQLKHCVERLAATPSVVQTHGSYRPKHVFVADGVTTAIDLDRSLLADPAKDVAEFVADLRSAAYDGQYDRETAERAADAFLEEYLEQAPGLAVRVACYSACNLTLRMLKSMKRTAAADPGWPERFDLYCKEIHRLCRKP